MVLNCFLGVLQVFGCFSGARDSLSSKQRREEKRLLRVDRYFRTHGPTVDRRVYRQRAAVERMNSRLKEQLSLNRHRVRGLRNVTIHALLCIIAMLLTVFAALNGASIF